MESFQVTALQSTINEVLTFRCIISVSCGRPFQLSLSQMTLEPCSSTARIDSCNDPFVPMHLNALIQGTQ